MRYVPHTPEDIREMLRVVGKPSVDALFEGVPEGLRAREIPHPDALDEATLLRHASDLAGRNAHADASPSFLGGIYARTHLPPLIDALASRGEFLTAYTPYQAEASQGTLQVIFEFQTLVCRLLGMDVANASMYDGATALAEAVLMACEGAGAATAPAGEPAGRRRVVVSAGVHPVVRDVLRTYMSNLPFDMDIVPLRAGTTDPREIASRVGSGAVTAAVVVQVPNVLGRIEDGPALAAAAGDVPVVALVDPTSLGIVRSPGEWGAQIAAAEGQPLGTAPSYGGPGVGLLAARKSYLRRMPGRIVGEARDGDGRKGYVLTLQTREQHIKRERATSNICTNEGLIALRTAIYLSALGPAGLREMGILTGSRARYLREKLGGVPGWKEYAPGPFFRETAWVPPATPAEVNRRLLERGIIGGTDLGAYDPAFEGVLVLSVNERVTRQDIDRLVEAARGMR